MVAGIKRAAKLRKQGKLAPKGKGAKPGITSGVAIYVTKAYRSIKTKSIDEMDESHLNIVLAYRELHRGSDQ